MSLKVIHYSPVWLPQTQTFVFTQIKYLPSDIEVHVICEKVENLEQFSVENIYSLESMAKLRVLWDKIVRKVGVRRHLNFLVEKGTKINAQILHSHFGHFAWRNIGAIRKLKLKHVVTFYGMDVNKVPRQLHWRKRYLRLFANVDAVLCEGGYMAECIAKLGCPKEKISVHRLGVELDDIVYKPRSWSATDDLNVLLAGRFTEKKGFCYALEALAAIKDRVRLKITIVGDALEHEVESREEKRRILATIDKFDLRELVRLLGFRQYKELRELAYEHQIFISPSVTAFDGDSEGGAPVTIIEMAASGMPVVSTRHCDIPEVIMDGETGLLANERDVGGLVECLQLLIDNPHKWSFYAKNARLHIEKNYNAKTQGQALSRIYETLSNRAS